MGKRRRPRMQYTSDDDDDDGGGGHNAAPEIPKTIKPTVVPDSSRPDKQQRRHTDELVEEGEHENDLVAARRNEEEERREDAHTLHRGGSRKPGRSAEDINEELKEKKAEGAEEEEEDEDGPDAVPVGKPVKVTDKGNAQRKHYDAFECEGNTYKLWDTAMFVPELENQKPYVGIIKDIHKIGGSLSVTAQWFYRPEEADEDGGEPRELFYSSHIDEVPAGSVMHTCMVHFIPQHKQVPSMKEHPGFIVQKVYDHIKEKLWDVADKDYLDNMQHEVDLLVKETMDRIGELPDRDPEDIPGSNADKFSSKFSGGLRKRPVNPKDGPTTGTSQQFVKADTPWNYNLNNYAILERYKAITGNPSRDRWIDKFVDTILTPCKNDTENSYPPNVVVQIVASLERSAFEAFYADFQKYNQKMRTLLFNIKENSVLRKQLMNKELDPVALLTMAPAELKAGLMPAEITPETEEPRQLQMTESRCKGCAEKNVGITELFLANRGGRYKGALDPESQMGFPLHDTTIELSRYSLIRHYETIPFLFAL
ncbi:hypothetical protein BRADI_2g14070v3 [Brachypodium distachyon]|uniref:BAH domain-containing protein n=1 Tax=Brachypodium distachyon TaxID=15368 RepID=A0A2K2D8J1_BRADI|nr:hypothetical protein BRADI_2g14070v3 [Brachypodium distachyon]